MKQCESSAWRQRCGARGAKSATVRVIPRHGRGCCRTAPNSSLPGKAALRSLSQRLGRRESALAASRTNGVPLKRGCSIGVAVTECPCKAPSEGVRAVCGAGTSKRFQFHNKVYATWVPDSTGFGLRVSLHVLALEKGSKIPFLKAVGRGSREQVCMGKRTRQKIGENQAVSRKKGSTGLT